MKFIKSLICNCLCINNLFYSKNRIHKTYPKKKISFKYAKNILLDNNLYFDIYNYHYTFNNQYKKYNDLTAEHIFPQSFIKEYPESKFDMHNIYLTSANINNFRSNYKYMDHIHYLKIINENKYISLPKTELKLYNDYSYYKSNSLKIFIPNNYSRGMIARSIAYMKIMYININIDNVIDINTLKKWNILYPPNLYEKNRNNIIKYYQGNENIFITNFLLIKDFF